MMLDRIKLSQSQIRQLSARNPIETIRAYINRNDGSLLSNIDGVLTIIPYYFRIKGIDKRHLYQTVNIFFGIETANSLFNGNLDREGMEKVSDLLLWYPGVKND